MRIITLTILLTGMLHLLHAQPEAIFTVHFDTDVSDLSEQAETTISDQTKAIATPADYRVQLIGHTDQRGSWDYNKALSERRAASVKAQLLTLGFNAGQINWKGVSYDDPVDAKDTEDAWTKNRRVDVIIEKSSWNVPADYYTIETGSPSTLHYERSGTKIEVPADAFMKKNGEPVEGDVLIYYREFRDFADFMASDLPMNFEMNGEDVYFNSTGMFEIRAYNDSEEVMLRPGKSIGLDIVQTQVLEGTQFWRFNETTNTWESGSSSIITQEGTWENVPVDTVKRPACATQLHIKQLSLSKLRQMIPLTLAILDSAAQYDDQYIPQMDKNKYRQRFAGYETRGDYAGMHYVGHLSHEEIKDNPKYYNIALERVGIENGTIRFQIKDLANENPELAAFEGAVWEFRSSENHKSKDQEFSFGSQNWSDIRIYQGKERRWGKGVKFNRHKPYRLKLKDGNSFTELEVRLLSVDGEDISKRKAKQTYRTYSDTLRARRRAFDQQINEQVAATQNYWEYLKVLLPRYYPVPFNLSGGLDCECFSNTNQHTLRNTESPCYSFLLDQAVYLEQHFQDLQKELNTDHALKQHVVSFDGKITSDKVLYEPIYQEFSAVTPRLNLSGLGKFNLDVLKRFKDQERLFANFENERGESIDFKKVDVINYDLNGLLSFTDPNIYLDLGAPTTIVVYDKNDRIYSINPAELNQLDLKNRRVFTFSVRELPDGINDPQELREALAYGD